MSLQVEPWEVLAEKRLSEIGETLLVGSGKGGVGKSVVSAALALALAKKGYKVGLFDLDVHGPSIPAILGIKNVRLTGSRRGLEPVPHRGMKVMSLAFLVGDNPLPLKGAAKTEVVEDIISNTDWGSLDYLVVDLPPGTGDEMLLSTRIFRRHTHRFLVVATPSIIALSVVKRLVSLLRDEKIRIAGIVENMATLSGGAPHPGSQLLEKYAETENLRVLAKIPFDETLEEVLLKGAGLENAPRFWHAVEGLAESLTGT